MVSDPIDTTLGSWYEDVVSGNFLLCDVEVILSIPLNQSWPRDKLVWQYTMNGSFTVKLAYHLQLNEVAGHDVATQIWEGSPFDHTTWDSQFRTLRDCVEVATKALSVEELEQLVVMFWETWNARNQFIFCKADPDPARFAHPLLLHPRPAGPPRRCARPRLLPLGTQPSQI
ncbi:hypothetical protein Cgig2_004476 [Carnegiea gigantea]|uniref:Uncharacterized protein n=1 Tax=Carnegiea gigantea TaxID=171969 RepID=A0A9Q1JL44_9CARY|nr:hypothetical protein Cgig2_004476 [Carnegiea gigantea]